MPRHRRTDLAGRLAPHLPQRFDPAVFGWWPAAPSPWRRSGDVSRHPGRIAQLAQVVDRLALLLGVGDDIGAALARIVRTGSGAVVTELDEVVAMVTAGVPTASALRTWARRTACPHVAMLAADLRVCTSADDVTRVLERHAATLYRHAHAEQVRRLRGRVTTVWVAAAAVCAATAVLVAA